MATQNEWSAYFKAKNNIANDTSDAQVVALADGQPSVDNAQVITSEQSDTKSKEERSSCEAPCEPCACNFKDLNEDITIIGTPWITAVGRDLGAPRRQYHLRVLFSNKAERRVDVTVRLKLVYDTVNEDFPKFAISENTLPEGFKENLFKYYDEIKEHLHNIWSDRYKFEVRCENGSICYLKVYFHIVFVDQDYPNRNIVTNGADKTGLTDEAEPHYKLLIRYVPGYVEREAAGYTKDYDVQANTNSKRIALDYPVGIKIGAYNSAVGRPPIPDYAKTVITHEYGHTFGLTDEYYTVDDHIETVQINYELSNDPESKISFKVINDEEKTRKSLMGNFWKKYMISGTDDKHFYYPIAWVVMDEYKKMGEKLDIRVVDK